MLFPKESLTFKIKCINIHISKHKYADGSDEKYDI